ncbi:hypothetical protein Pst134EB_010550 [Puccinia striiformis f. sp. tritici]|nr:hypothetical protein Pst134EB_010550 [Puccinia striiformis f. sp. tritici]
MANGRKRCKNLGSSISSLSSSRAPSKEPPPKKRPPTHVQDDEDSDDEPHAIDVDSTTPGSPQTSKHSETSDEQELHGPGRSKLPSLIQQQQLSTLSGPSVLEEITCLFKDIV